MLYIASRDKEVLGFPFIADNLEEAHQKLIVQQKDKLVALEETFEYNVEMLTMETKKQIAACDNIIEAEKESKATDKETKETAKQARKFKGKFKKDIKAITEGQRKEIDAVKAIWEFNIEDLDIYEIAPLDKKTK